MTTEVKKTLRATAVVLLCIGAVSVGAIWRDQLELGASGTGDNKLDISNLVASTSDRAELPETKFFEDIRELLKRKYVDQIDDDTKLADGAVRGMIASLGDPNSLYMDQDQFRVYSNAAKGKYEGIGADLVLARDRPQGKVQVGGEEAADENVRLPKLMIACIVPGGPADRAGLKPGDWVEFVDDHWIPNSDALDKFEALFEQVKAHKASSDEFLKMRRQLREESDKRILPIKARDRLMIGTAGIVKAQWVRGDKRIETTLERAECEMPGFTIEQDGSIRLPFDADSVEKFRAALNGKTEAVVDLRNNVEGNFDAMLACLKLVAPNGSYGYLVTHKDEKPGELTISDGAPKAIKLTLLVDRTTRGAAEIFALALSSRGLAKLSGMETAGNRFVVRWFSLPDGAGYTLVTSEYRTNAPTGAVARSMATADSPVKGNALLPTKPKGTDDNREAHR